MTSEETEGQKNIAGWVEKRSEDVVGRRQNDAKKCSMHDYMFGKQDDCLAVIKSTIKTETAKFEHRYEMFDLKLEKFITRWALGIIGAVVSFLSMIIVTGFAWQFLALREDVKQVEVAIVAMNQTSVESMTELKLKQAGVIKFIEGLEPEHQELMDFLRHSREIDSAE